jgi:hypothetical protein
MAKKKITKRPSKKGLKQKQKQSQSVVVNVNTTKARSTRQPSHPSRTSQPVYRPPTQYITLQSEPLPPVIYNSPVVRQPVFEPVSTPVSTPAKTTNSIGTQSFDTVFIKVKRPSKIPLPIQSTNREAVINLENIYNTPENFQQSNPIHTPIARRTRAALALTPDELERRRIDRNERARQKYQERKMGG